MVTVCPSCTHENMDKAKFCLNCGYKIGDGAEHQTNADRYAGGKAIRHEFLPSMHWFLFPGIGKDDVLQECQKCHKIKQKVVSGSKN